LIVLLKVASRPQHRVAQGLAIQHGQYGAINVSSVGTEGYPLDSAASRVGGGMSDAR
jgi:hypothetical protein